MSEPAPDPSPDLTFRTADADAGAMPDAEWMISVLQVPGALERLTALGDPATAARVAEFDKLLAEEPLVIRDGLVVTMHMRPLPPQTDAPSA